ncbi:hypothetical protein HY745_04595 [Candidatus Desantisbacteria bacterium]|nr:hypothetical protein [Candidatus Desantisbacteria bacterium]
MFQKYFPCIHILIIIILLSISGCASVNSGSFIKFNNAVKEASTGIDAAMSVNHKWTRAGFISGFSADSESKFSQLIIQPGEKYNWLMEKPPIYLDIKKAHFTLTELNNAFIQYADLLVKLSGGELINIDTFDQLTKDINKNAAEAAKALNMSVSSDNLALISTTSLESARLYIEHKKKGYLIETIKKNQESVQKYSDACILLIHIMIGNLKTYYVEKYEPIKITWNASSGLERQKQTEAMLDINDQFINALEILKELETAYTALSKAHEELAISTLP